MRMPSQPALLKRELRLMRIVTDIAGLERVAPPGVNVSFVEPGHPFALARQAFAADWLIVHFDVRQILILTTLLALWPFHRCKIVTLDFFAVNPSPRLLPWLRWSLRRIHLLLVYFRDFAPFAALYGLPLARFRYVPFKVNSWELVQQATPTDEGFIFVGGRSRRDFATLFAAVAPLGYPVKILTAHEPDILPHGSSLAGLTIPPNVELLYNDSDNRFFVDLASRARLVVLPIRADAKIQAGIGVYLLSMALQKCVIISRCLGVDDVLAPGLAVIVDPGDAAQLRHQIEYFWLHAEERQAIATRARDYAFSLGGEDHLRRSILTAIGVL